jgi:signal transduction histidine kinase/phage shock protein PspC (stress-responsive transcriptional regulator)
MSTRESAPPRATDETVKGSGAMFRRSSSDRVIAGVAGGLGERLDTDPVVVRLAFVALVMAGGAGLLLYLAAWVLSSEPETRDEVHEPPTSSVQQTIAISLVVLGALVLLRFAGLWFGDAWVWPVALAAFGSALIWTRDDADVRARWNRWAHRIPGIDSDSPLASPSVGRLIGGGLLIAAGMGLFLAANDALPALRNLVFAVAVTLAGGVLILGPGVLGLVRQLSEERRERIRSQERAEMAAHLHDSVLQTLALLQRTESMQEVTRLARRQERELRSWLYGRTQALGNDHLSTAVEEMATRVESLHDVSVEVVVVGDRPLDDDLSALVAALGEATTNAARHSGADEVSVYVEVEPEEVNAFVRDQGKGFDLDGVGEDRRGIAHSIVGRMRRVGGEATITSRIGEGTEVHLELAP